jgi:hypothetical protein
VPESINHDGPLECKWCAANATSEEGQRVDEFKEFPCESDIEEQVEKVAEVP